MILRRYILYIIGVMMAVNAAAQMTYQRVDSVKVCQLLERASQEKGNVTLWLARQFIGVPYVAHTLEVNDTEQLVVNTRELDCTTLVETVTALTLCVQQGKKSFADYTDMLRLLRYRQGRMNGYPSRLHYFTDWIDDKQLMGIVREIQKPNPPFSDLQKIAVSYMSEHPQSYKALKEHPDYVPVIRRQEQALTGNLYHYIPKTSVRNTRLLRQTIHDGDIIAITCNKKGLDIAHLGFAVWHKDGLHLLNASSIHKKVVEEPMTLFRYLQKHSSFTGIRIIRVKN